MSNYSFNSRILKVNRDSDEIVLSSDAIDDLRECIEVLRAIEAIRYHNKNWLPLWAIQNPKELSQEILTLLDRALDIIGTSALQPHT